MRDRHGFVVVRDRRVSLTRCRLPLIICVRLEVFLVRSLENVTHPFAVRDRHGFVFARDLKVFLAQCRLPLTFRVRLEVFLLRSLGSVIHALSGVSDRRDTALLRHCQVLAIRSSSGGGVIHALAVSDRCSFVVVVVVVVV